MKGFPKRSVFGVLGIIAIAAGILITYAAHLRATAEKILGDVSQLTVGQSTFEDAKRIADQYASRVSTEWMGPGTSPPGPRNQQGWNDCSPVRCSFNVRVKNDKLAALRITFPAEFVANIIVVNDRVAVIRANLSGGGTSPAAGGVSYSDEWDQNPIPGNYTLWSPAPVTLLAFVNNKATVEQKHRAFSMNMKCLSYRGKSCTAPGDYLPLAWEDWQRANKKKSTSWLGYAASI